LTAAFSQWGTDGGTAGGPVRLDSGGPGDGHRVLLPVRPSRVSALAPLLALVLGVAVVLVARWGPDWPAQEFRAWVAAHDGLTAWTSRWYGGEALPGYSVLYPVLGGAFGSGPVGVASVVVAAWASASMAPAQPVRARWFALAVAASLIQNLVIGQVPYLLGAAFAMLAIRSLVRAESAVAVGVFAAACSLASPLAGACLLLALPALAVVFGRRRAQWLATSAAGIGVAVLVGGASGPFPFPWQSFAGVVLFCVLTAALSSGNRALRWFAICYLIAAAVLFLAPNAVGGNAARVGKLVVVPLAVRFVDVSPGLIRRLTAGLVLTLAAVWPSLAFASSIARGAGDPSQRAQYYSGLTAFLRTQNSTLGRIEIPFTREHWEALWVARTFPLARGWERQTDLLYNQVLYRPLSAQQYRNWLYANAVSLVALPTVPIDYGGKAEAALLRHPPAYLRPAWHDDNWQVWRVAGAHPLVSGPAVVSAMGAASIRLSFSRAGQAVVRIHASPLWRVRDGAACVDASPTGWLRVYADRPGAITIEAEVNAGLVTGEARCAP
jgi:hypothetical protein